MLSVARAGANAPDWASVRTWLGGPMTGGNVTVTRRWDQSGNGNHQVAPDRASQPYLLDEAEINGMIPLVFDGDIQVATNPTPKCLQVALDSAINRNNYAFAMAFKARTPHSGNTFFELFGNADFTHTGASVNNGDLMYGLGDSWSDYCSGGFGYSQIKTRSHLTTVAKSNGPIGTSSAQKNIIRAMGTEVSPNTAPSTSSVPLLAMRTGKGSPNANTYSGLDDFGQVL